MRINRQFWIPWVLTLELLVGVLAINASADPQPERPKSVPVWQLPKPLVAVVKQRFPDGKILRAVKSAPEPMDEGGSMSLTVSVGKKEIRVEVSCANAFYQINWISRDIAPAELPAFVLETVQSKHPHATVKSAQEVQSGLMGQTSKSPRPADYYLRIKTANDEELDISLTPVLKQDAEGNWVPDPGKVMIQSESPVTKTHKP